MAFPSVSGTPSTTGFASSVTSMPVTLPTSASGDLFLAVVCVRNSGTWSTIPTGWTQLFTPVAAGGVGDLTVFYKKASGSDGTSATWVASTATTASWQVVDITGWDGTTAPANVTKNSGGAVSTNSFNSLSPSWGAASTLWLALMGTTASGTTISAAPSGFSGLQSNSVSSGGSQCNTGFAWLQLNTATETPGSFTTSSDRWWMTATIAINPASGGGGAVYTSELSMLGVG